MAAHRYVCETGFGIAHYLIQGQPNLWWERWVSSPLCPKATVLQTAAFADSLLSHIAAGCYCHDRGEPMYRQGRAAASNFYIWDGREVSNPLPMVLETIPDPVGFKAPPIYRLSHDQLGNLTIDIHVAFAPYF